MPTDTRHPSGAERAGGAGDTGPGREQIRLSNCDLRAGHAVAVTVRDADGDPVFERRYFLDAGQTKRELDVAAPGDYAVTVAHATGPTRRLTCRLGPAPGETVAIEIGDGTLDVAAGRR